MKPLLIRPIRLLKPFRSISCRVLYQTTAFLLITSATKAQSFRFRAKIEAIQQSGYHRIQLPPTVIGHLNATLTDIRLYNDKQQEVPYQLIQERPVQTTSFIDYEVISKLSRPRISTILIIRNRSKSRIRLLDIVVKNTNVGKKVRLSGSSDQQTWYAIDDNVWLGPTQSNATTTDTKTINFPLSDYEYYRLDVNDSLSTPLNIMRVGYYDQKASAGTYSAIPDLAISQRDSSDKHTYVHLTRADNARFDKLAITISTPTQYRRQAELGQFRTRKLKRGRVERWFEPIISFELSSADSNVAYLPGLRAKDLYIAIANDDNPPLKIGSVRAYQLTTFLLANLRVASPYQLHFSAGNVAAPAYDPTPFNINMPDNVPIIGVNQVTSNQADNTKTTSFFTDSRIIWLALGLVLLILGIMSYRMLREMGKANQEPN